MQVLRACLLLLIVRVCGAAARAVLRPVSVDSHGPGLILTPQNSYNGWVNPEDLTPMPQCIAQQDHSAWLSAMTKCTGKQCTHHFGVICAHHQWLTQLSCLSVEVSPAVIKDYFPLCSRSVLAKAQLYQWIRSVTGRTWLVDVGDTNGLHDLSPASLVQGYAAVDVVRKAPTCLTVSASASSMEPFQHVVASCSFTGTSQHTGNAARPWEYNERLKSMIALDSETVGYDLTQHSIRNGDYFDIECFCGAFEVQQKTEPCLGLGSLELTKERLWMNATCGSTSVPGNWTGALKTTTSAYIPTDSWHWPKCVTDMPEKITELKGKCETDACELDSSGYCKVVRAVDRACFCHDISYNSCGGLCHTFETRIDYVKWLHGLCSNVESWQGLPDDWRQLAAPTYLDMIPWRWTVRPTIGSTRTSVTRPESVKASETCASTEWKLASFALINLATFFTALLSKRTDIHLISRVFPWHSRSWFLTGISIATIQLLVHWFNASLVQNTLGYEDIPAIQLILLWCSIPRLSWLTTLFGGAQFNTVASSLFAEAILQALSSHYMIMTVNYGREHMFYRHAMKRLDGSTPAKFIYTGALLWLIVIIVALVQLLQITFRKNRLDEPESIEEPKWQRSRRPRLVFADDLMALFNIRWTWVEEKMARPLLNKGLGETPSTGDAGRSYMAYGTLPVKSQNNVVAQKGYVRLYAVAIISMLLLWIAQWLFWGGFIALSTEEFCPPKLGALTAVWVTSSLASATIGAI